MKLAIWDIESSNANTDFGSIIEVGGILSLTNDDFLEEPAAASVRAGTSKLHFTL